MGNNSEDFLYLIDQIEEIRSKNNKNWMDILRVAFSYAPNETKKLIKEIYIKDQEISELVNKLTTSR